MSGLINKAKEVAKDVLHGDKREDPRSDNSGPHKSNIMNKLDPTVDSDRDNRDNPNSRVGGYGDDRTFSDNTGAYGTGSTMGGGNQYDNPRSDNAGPHSSNIMNKADPRVDSDRDGRNDPSSRVGGYGQTQEGYGSNTGAAYDSTTGGVGGGQYDNPRSTNTGPHSSNIMNKADPRIDSDRDGRNDPTSRVGGYGDTQQGYGSGGGFTDTDATRRTGGDTYGGTTGGMGGSQYDDPRSTNTGPHSSNIMNKADPRVDSDRDGRNDPTSRIGGYGDTQQGYGSGGGFTDSSMPGTQHHRHHRHHQTPGSGNAPSTAGPHDSNIMNKLDPRVDSDMDGSRTYGGDRTNY